MRFFGLKSCDSCRKAMKSLQNARFVDIRDDPIPLELLKRALETFGEKLVNTRSTTWRGLDGAARARAPLDLLQTYPALMKRPLVEHEGQLYLGWDSQVQKALGVD